MLRAIKEEESKKYIKTISREMRQLLREHKVQMEIADDEKELRFHELLRSATDNFEPVVLKVKDLVEKVDDLSVEA